MVGGLPDAAKANLHAILFENIQMPVAGIAYAGGFQRFHGAFPPGILVVDVVVVGQVDAFHAAQPQDVGILRQAPEVMHAPLEALFPRLQNHLQVYLGQVVLGEDVADAAKGPRKAPGRQHGIEGFSLAFLLIVAAQHTVAAKGQHNLVRHGLQGNQQEKA